MNDRADLRQAMREAGLCGTCVHARVIETDRGRCFMRCDRSRTDPAFARYPRLPVIACAGHEVS